MNTQIRLTKTPQISQIISAIQSQYVLLDDVDVIKLALSNQYYSMQNQIDETEYLTGSTKNRMRLDSAIAQPNETSKRFSITKNLADELGVNY
jgi:hypothetical protein